MPRKKAKASPAREPAPGAPGLPPSVAPSPRKRGKRKSVAGTRVRGPLQVEKPVSTGGVAAQTVAASIGKSPYLSEFQPPADFTFWNDADHAELAEAWLSMNERQQQFFTEWFSNGFHGTNAYEKVYDQKNREIAAVSAAQLLGSTNILRLRRAIWLVQLPPFERMAAVERDVLEANEDIDPKAYKIKLMKLSAVQSIRQFHNVPSAMMPGKPKTEDKKVMKGTFELDISDVKDILNGGV